MRAVAKVFGLTAVALTLSVFFGCPAAVDGQGGFNTSLPTDPADVPPVLESTNSLKECVCTLQCSGIAAVVKWEQGVPYHHLKLQQAVATDNTGKAEVPFFVLHFAVPLDAETHEPANWHVTVTADNEASYEYIRPYPAQPPAWLDEWSGPGKPAATMDEDPSLPDFVLDDAFYASTAPYPGYDHQAGAFQMGNLSMVRVQVFPVQYYAAQRRLALAQRLHVKVSFDSPNGLMAPVILGDYTGTQTPGDEEWMTDFAINREIITAVTVADLATDLAAIDPDGIHDDPFQLLIITRDDLVEEARELARWRQDTGTRVWLRSYGTGAVPDADTIRDYIMDLDEDNLVPDLLVVGLPAMSAILLFGDTEIIPTCLGMNYRAQPTPDDPNESIVTVGTDLYYTTIRGDDDVPDVAIGRISVDDGPQAQAVVDKIIRYESRAPMDRPNHMSVYSYFQDDDLDGEDDWVFVMGAERVRHFMLDRGVTARFGYARSGGPTPVLGYEGAPLAADLVGYAWDADPNLIQSHWRSGLDGIVLHCDHGRRDGWYHPEFDCNDLVAMDDPENAYYPIYIGLNCSSGWFDNETDTLRFGDDTLQPYTETAVDDDESFCEMALRHVDGGAVAAIGACRGSSSNPNNKLLDGLFGALYRDYEEGTLVTRPPMPTFYRLGPAFLWAKFHQVGHMGEVGHMGYTDRQRYNMEIYNLLGDPMMTLRLPEPPD